MIGTVAAIVFGAIGAWVAVTRLVWDRRDRWTELAKEAEDADRRAHEDERRRREEAQWHADDQKKDRDRELIPGLLGGRGATVPQRASTHHGSPAKTLGRHGLLRGRLDRRYRGGHLVLALVALTQPTSPHRVTASPAGRLRSFPCVLPAFASGGWRSVGVVPGMHAHRHDRAHSGMSGHAMPYSSRHERTLPTGRRPCSR